MRWPRPLADGVTHPVIRKAAGLWARRALVAWNEGHPDPRHLPAGETPFVGNRFVELARRLAQVPGQVRTVGGQAAEHEALV